MANYVLPQVQVFQEASVVPTPAASVLRAHISGPHAYLLRYTDSDEQEKGFLGYYDKDVDTAYPWPDRPAGAIVDTDYTKVYIKDGLLRYFIDEVGSGSTITKVANYNNRIRSNTVLFADSENSEHSTSLLDRGVKIGDIAKVRALDENDDEVTLWTYVKDLIADVIPTEVGNADTDAANAETISAGTSITQIAGPENCVTLDADPSAFKGITYGYPTETYTIIVTQSSINGDFTTARLRVISASGDDDDVNVSPEAEGDPTAIGAWGLTVTFNKSGSDSCSSSAEAADVSPDDLIVGQKFQVVVSQDFTATTVTSGGTYTGEHATTYIVTVTRGGDFTDDLPPQISVTTTTGVDVSGPTDITEASTPYDVGQYGVTIEFDQTSLNKGDKFYIEVTDEEDGDVKTIALGHNLSEEIADGTQVSLELFIKKPLLEVEMNRTGEAPLTNWEMTETEIIVSSAITAYDETWTDDGTQVALPVFSGEEKKYGKVYVHYRAWRSELSDEVIAIDDAADLDTLISGPLHPDNPLKWGVFKALQNSNGAEVLFSSVADPSDTESWNACLELLVDRADVYGLVPLTRDRTVLDLYAAHVKAQSTADHKAWRVLWTSLEGLPEIPIVHAGSTVPGYTTATTTDELVAQAVIEDDPETSGTQYTKLRCTSGNAQFETNGVLPGDIVRISYTGDGFGNYVWDEYVVDEVTSEDQLRLIAGPDAEISVGVKFEIWRTLSATQEAAAIAGNAGSWGDRRIRAVWPDRIESSGTVMEGYHLCAALAGLCSGVLPHQGLTRLEIVGFTDVPRTTAKFNGSQLNTMAAAGTWIVTQDRDSGNIYTRHAVTTGDYDDINEREESITRNVDAFSYEIDAYLTPYIGVTNRTPIIRERIRMDIENLLDFQTKGTSTNTLGPRLISGAITRLEDHAIFRDQFVLALDCVFPYATNVIVVRVAF